MRTQRLAIALTVINLLILLFTVAQTRSTAAQTTAPLLRVSALEVVDEHGVVRARLNVKGGPNGPIELDLFDRRGIVRVKLGAGENGSGLVVSDEGTDSASRSYVQIIASRTGPNPTGIVVRGAAGQQRVIRP